MKLKNQKILCLQIIETIYKQKKYICNYTQRNIKERYSTLKRIIHCYNCQNLQENFKCYKKLIKNLIVKTQWNYLDETIYWWVEPSTKFTLG